MLGGAGIPKGAKEESGGSEAGFRRVLVHAGALQTLRLYWFQRFARRTRTDALQSEVGQTGLRCVRRGQAGAGSAECGEPGGGGGGFASRRPEEP